MSLEDKKLGEDLRAMFQQGWEIFEGEVTAVDEDKLLVDVEMAEGVTDFDIKLRAVSDGKKNGVVLIPKMGSKIVYGKIIGESDLVIIRTSEVDKVIIDAGVQIDIAAPDMTTKIKSSYNIETGTLSVKASGKVAIEGSEIEMNGGSNGGIPIEAKVMAELNKHQADITILKAVFTAWLPAVGDMGEGLRTAVAAWAGAPLLPTAPKAMENPKVTH